jgi:hypothetical protein
MPAPSLDEAVEAILQVAARDASIARVLHEICALETGLRASALDLVGAHLRLRAAGGDALDTVALLKRDEVVRRIAARLDPPGA